MSSPSSAPLLSSPRSAANRPGWSIDTQPDAPSHLAMRRPSVTAEPDDDAASRRPRLRGSLSPSQRHRPETARCDQVSHASIPRAGAVNGYDADDDAIERIGSVEVTTESQLDHEDEFLTTRADVKPSRNALAAYRQARQMQARESRRAAGHGSCQHRSTSAPTSLTPGTPDHVDISSSDI